MNLLKNVFCRFGLFQNRDCCRFAGKNERIDVVKICCAANVSRLCAKRFELLDVLAEITLEAQDADQGRMMNVE
jgi:hypothetical protein